MKMNSNMNLLSARQTLLEILKDVEPINKYRHIVFVQKNRYCNIYLNEILVCKTNANIYKMTKFFIRRSYFTELPKSLKTTIMLLDDDLNAFDIKCFDKYLNKEEHESLFNKKT